MLFIGGSALVGAYVALIKRRLEERPGWDEVWRWALAGAALAFAAWLMILFDAKFGLPIY